MIREKIKTTMKERNITQRSLCTDTGIEYSAFNTFVNNKKGLYYEKVQMVLDYLGLEAIGTFKMEDTSMRNAICVEMKLRNIKMPHVAKELGRSYCSVWNYINGKEGMSLEDVETLMCMLNITLKSKEHGHDDCRAN